MAGLVALSLALAPVCWTHYQLLQYPRVAMLLTAAIRRRYWWITVATAASFALAYQLPQRFLIAYHDAHVGGGEKRGHCGGPVGASDAVTQWPRTNPVTRERNHLCFQAGLFVSLPVCGAR
jgi:hypothetical protein